MRTNILTAYYKEGELNVIGSLYQYDYGQRIVFADLDLPTAYEVHFSSDERGESYIMIGDSTGVDIPDELLQTGKNVYVWIYLHTGENDGETVYRYIINVRRRAEPIHDTPTPVQRNEIEQAIAVLNGAIETTAQDVIDANVAKEAAEEAQGKAEEAITYVPYVDSITGNWMKWDAALERYVDTGVHAQGEKGDTGDKGDKGDTGTVPDIHVGNVTTSATETSVTRQAGSPNERPVFDFAIKKGDKGDRGKDFHIAKTFASISAMEAYSGTDLEPYDFVMIDTGNVEDPDTGKLYCYEPESTPKWHYIGDLSGKQGIKGETGTGIADITLNSDYTLTITMDDDPDNPTTYTTTSIRGAAGYSPSASVSKISDTATITVTDESGTTTASIYDGSDGYSPSASVSKSGNTSTITITDKYGTTTATVTDGAKGPTGATGATGATPQLSIGTVTDVPYGTGSSVTITGTTAAPVLNFQLQSGQSGNETIDDTAGLGDTDFVWSADKTDKEVIRIDGTKANTDSAFTYKETSGSVVEFDDGVSEAVKRIDIAIAPLQDLHGYDHPWVGGAGRNKCPYFGSRSDTTSGVTITVRDDGSILLTGTETTASNTNMFINGKSSTSTSIFSVPNGTYRFTGGLNSSVYFVLFDGETRYDDRGTGVDVTVTTGQIRIRGVILNGTASSVYNNVVLYPMLRLSTDTDSTYEPYSNICPISGWTGAEVMRVGRNLLPVINTAGVTHNSVTWTNNGDGSWTADGTATDGNSYPVPGGTKQYDLGILPSGAYTVSVRDAFGHIIDDICNVRVGYGSSSTLHVSAKGYASFTADGSTQYYFTFNVANGSTANNLTIYPQVEAGSVVTPYVAPKNTYTVFFPSSAGTVYGGSLTVNKDGTGTLVVDRGIITIDGTESFISSGATSAGALYLEASKISVFKKSETGKDISDKYRVVTGLNGSSLSNGEATKALDDTTRLYFKLESLANKTATELATYFASNNVQYCGMLKSVSTYTLTTDQVIHLLSGHNTVYADCGDITLLYPTDKYLTAEQAEKERIHESIAVSASVQTIDDGADNVPMDVSVAIEPVQDLHGYANPWVGGAGKNILKTDGTTGVSGNVTFTINSDGSITANGTNTTGSLISFPSSTSSAFAGIPAGDYYFTSGLETGSATTWDAFIWDSTSQKYPTDWSGNANTVSFDTSFKQVKLESNHIYSVLLHVRSGVSINNITFRPMLCKSTETDTSWAPYENICPISGWDKAEVTRTGKNFLTAEFVSGKSINSAGAITTNNARSSTVDFIPVIVDTEYILSYAENVNNGVFFYSNNNEDSFISYLSWDEAPRTFTTPANAKYVRLSYYSGTLPTNVKLVIPTTYSISFPSSAGTVYGGSLTVNKDGTGTLVVDSTKMSLANRASTNITDINATYDSGKKVLFWVTLMTQGTRNPSETDICNIAKTIVQNGTTVGFYPYQTSYPNSVRFVMPVSIGTTAQEIADFLTANEAEITYKLTTPVTYTLPAPVIRSLLGTNNIWADTGNVLLLNYSADTKLYIDNLTKPNEDDMIANENIATDTYFTINNTLYKSTEAIAQGETINPNTGGNCVATSVAEVFNSLLSAEGVSF